MKNKRNKGFTLIELLAVIVILAVIALIATPLIMNVINDAKKGAARDSGYNIIKAGEFKAGTEGIQGINPPYHYDENSNLDLKGTKPTKMTLDINKDMDTQLRAWLNGYCVIKNYGNETVTIDESKKSESDCVTGGGSSGKDKYENGEAIYFNPETGKKCSDYTEANSLNETKSGCMKWYAFNDSESSSTVNAILDHNTTARIEVEYGASSDEALKKARAELNNDVNTWNNSLKPRLIEANEITEIIEYSDFDSNISTVIPIDSEIPLGDGSLSKTNRYKWLIDYTDFCEQVGCDIEDDNTDGYWTNTPCLEESRTAWYVFGGTNMLFPLITEAMGYMGIRPVISIPKSSL